MLFFIFIIENLTLLLFLPSLKGDSNNILSSISIMKSVRVNIFLDLHIFTEYFISFALLSRLIKFVVVVLQLLLFNFCDSQKSSIFYFSGTKMVKKTHQYHQSSSNIWKTIRVNTDKKTIENFLTFKVYHFSSNFNETWILL